MAWSKMMRVLGASALGFLGLVGCGDDDEDGPRDASTTTDGGPRDAGLDSSVGIDSGLDGSVGRDASADAGRDAQAGSLSFFVTSDRSTTGNLGGIAAADARCQRLATAVGAGTRKWRAFVSVEAAPADGSAKDARDRIGTGPWYNARGALIANDVGSLLARFGDAELYLDEKGQKINGQWSGSPTPNEHDVLTGTGPDGRVSAGKTCADWASDSASLVAVVGHTDALGPMGSDAGQYSSWYSTHDNMNCSDTAPRGGAGKLYCFAAD